MNTQHLLPGFRCRIVASRLIVLIACASVAQAQHVHLNAGALGTMQDAPLTFQNGSSYDTNAAYNVYLTFTNAGPFATLYQGSGVTRNPRCV